MKRTASQHYRQGTVLIITAGIAALLASLALTFLLRMRSDVSESLLTVRDAQARIMLVAACNYILEAGRIGYDDSNDQYHKEAYGWIDVRDGSIGPKPSKAAHGGPGQQPYGEFGFGKPDSISYKDQYYFPTQSVRICQLHALKRPPYAISLRAAPNPIDPDPPTDGIPWLSNPDPVLPPAVAGLPNSDRFTAWEEGDRTPNSQSYGKSWFRLLRCGPGDIPELARYNAATFIVTCGAGGSQGYRSQDWATMKPEEKALFGNDVVTLATLEADEVRYWYMVEWSPAIGDEMANSLGYRAMTNPAVRNATTSRAGTWKFPQFTARQPNFTFGNNYGQPTRQRNFCGTIRYIQRLTQEPPYW